MKKKIVVGLTVAALSLCFSLEAALAYEIEDLNNTPVKNDFVLGPGKTELTLDPGDKFTKELTITNRIGRDMKFKIEIEDFKGSDNPEETVVLLGEEKGPYSLRDYLKMEVMEFTLSHGQRMRLPVEISIPEDAEPGGLYGSVLVSTTPSELTEEEKNVAGTMKMVSRLGTLFLIRVEGDVIEDGHLEGIKIRDPQKSFYEKGPISFEFLFKNNGNVHLTPYGKIEIKNLMGKKVGELEVEPYFAMPDSLRRRTIKWDKESLFGRYTATLALNRNYQDKDDVVDVASVAFWVIPWKTVLLVLTVIVLIVVFLRWFLRKFKFELKKKE